MSLTPTNLRRLTSSLTQGPWPRRSSPSKGFQRTSSTMTPHSTICFAKHTEYMSITPSEKACLSVSRRRLHPKERSDLLEERTHRLDFSTQKGQNLRNTNSTLIMTEEVNENKVKSFNLGKKNFIALKLKSFNDEINNFLWTVIAAKIRNYPSSLSKSLWNWQLKKFQSSIFDVLARRTRIRTPSWNFLAWHRNCKMKWMVWSIQKIFRMLTQHAVDIPTLPVDQCHSHLI